MIRLYRPDQNQNYPESETFVNVASEKMSTVNNKDRGIHALGVVIHNVLVMHMESVGEDEECENWGFIFSEHALL